MRTRTARILLPQRVMIPLVAVGFAIVAAVGAYHVVFGDSGVRSPEHALAEERARSLVNSARRHRTERGLTDCPSIAELTADPLVPRQALADPWGRSFLVECGGGAIRATSLGPDGARGTEDDVVAE